MCSYTPLFPTNASSGDPVYGVHWCEAGKRRRKACPMPSYDIPTPTRSLSPSDPVVKTTTYGYDYADARPPRRLERRYTDLDFDVEPPRLSRKHTHSGGSSDRHRKRMYIDDSPMGLRFVKPSSSRRKDRDHVVIVDRRDREKERERTREKDRDRRRDDRDARRDERIPRREDFDPYPSSKSRRNSLSREGLLGRSSTGLNDDFFTSTSRVFDDAPRVTTSTSRRKYEDVLPSESKKRSSPFEVVDAIPKDTYYAEEDAHRRRSHRSSRYPVEDDRYKSSSSRHHHDSSDRRDRAGFVEIEKANSSSRRPGRNTRYIEEHLRDPMHRSDLDRAEDELARQRKRTSGGSYGGSKLPADEGFFEPRESSSAAAAAAKRYSAGSYSRADLDKAYDKYEAAVMKDKKYDDKKYDDKKYDDKKYDEKKYDDKKYAEEKRYAEKEYAAEKAAVKAKYDSDRYAEKESEREHRSSRDRPSSSSSKYAAAAAAAAVGAAALAPTVFDATSRFDELEKSGKYDDFDYGKYEKEKGYDKYAVKDPRRDEYSSSKAAAAAAAKADKYDKYEKMTLDKYDKVDSSKADKADKADKYDRYGNYDKYDARDKYDAKQDKYAVKYGSASVFDDEDNDIEAAIQRAKLRRSSSSSSYHKPTVEEIDDDEKRSPYNKRPSRYSSDEVEPLFSSPSSSPPPSKIATVSAAAAAASVKRDREREARDDIDASSLKLSDADTENMLERRLETARMRAEILRMKELQEIEAQSSRMRSREGRELRDRERERDRSREREVKAIEAPREMERDGVSHLRRTPSLKKTVSWGDDM
jgi:hypothetical protein